METLVYEQFIPTLMRRLPQLDYLREEHVDAFGELLPHLLVDDLQRWAIANVDEQPTAVAELVHELDRCYREGDDRVVNAIDVSFLEHLPRPGSSGSGVRTMLTRDLAGGLAEIEHPAGSG